MATLRTVGGSRTLHDDVLVVVHAGASAHASTKAASQLRFPLAAVYRLEHVRQSKASGGHVRVHLVDDDRPPEKPTVEPRVCQLTHQRPQGLADVDGFVHATNQAASAAGEQPSAWPVPKAPQHQPVRQRAAAQGDVLEAPPRPARERPTAGDGEHRSTMRLLRLAHFTTTVQLLLLLLPVVVLVAVFVGVVVVF